MWLKRDDLFTVAGSHGGKARTCEHIIRAAKAAKAPGVVTAGSRHSPQVEIVAAIAKHYGMPCRAYVPAGGETEQTQAALDNGAVVERIRPGHNSVIVARAREYAQAHGWGEVPFGMETPVAVDMTARQVGNLPSALRRIVVPVGSGMTLCGVLQGLAANGRRDISVLGVRVGADPAKRLARYAPPMYGGVQLEMVHSVLKYDQRPEVTSYQGVELDPVYEAKCLPYLKPGDMLWVVGRRGLDKEGA